VLTQENCWDDNKFVLGGAESERRGRNDLGMILVRSSLMWLGNFKAGCLFRGATHSSLVERIASAVSSCRGVMMLLISVSAFAACFRPAAFALLNHMKP
jgi:hypothetical protein